jgi:hypothetical protein
MHCLEAAGSSPVPSLQASVRQQLEQSGLLPQLPALMIAAAVELSAQAKDKSFVVHSQLLAAGLPVPFYSGSIRHHSNHLCKAFCHASMLWSADDAGRLQALAGTCAAAMQLALAVTRHISAEVQEHMRIPGASGSNSFDMQVWCAGGFHVGLAEVTVLFLTHCLGGLLPVMMAHLSAFTDRCIACTRTLYKAHTVAPSHLLCTSKATNSACVPPGLMAPTVNTIRCCCR